MVQMEKGKSFLITKEDFSEINEEMNVYANLSPFDIWRMALSVKATYDLLTGVWQELFPPPNSAAQGSSNSAEIQKVYAELYGQYYR